MRWKAIAYGDRQRKTEIWLAKSSAQLLHLVQVLRWGAIIGGIESFENIKQICLFALLIINNIFHCLFLVKFHDGKEWELPPGIRMEGPLLTFECRKRCKPSGRHWHGARYTQQFTEEFSHFEVSFSKRSNNNNKHWLFGSLEAADYVT